MLEIRPAAYVWFALLLLVLPFPWLAAALMAAVVHEVFHILMVLILKGKVQRIQIASGGARLDSVLDEDWKLLLAQLAGPVGSLLLLFWCQRFPRLAICGCVHGIYNLVPIYPLDGGRILRCILHWWFPDRADRIGDLVENVVAILLAAAGLYGTVVLSLGALPLIVCALPMSPWIQRKFPCKPGRIGVQ